MLYIYVYYRLQCKVQCNRVDSLFLNVILKPEGRAEVFYYIFRISFINSKPPCLLLHWEMWKKNLQTTTITNPHALSTFPSYISDFKPTMETEMIQSYRLKWTMIRLRLREGASTSAQTKNTIREGVTFVTL